jgi:PAB-dependent poly(A)-specific ribonuclease subunit 2
VLLDDWICPAEPVLDHLTRFSGVKPGELDAATSPRRLLSERAVSLKLRALVDAGVVWVGHGLRSDFAVLGMCPPASRVRDTAALYMGIDGRARKLRLLASTVLGSSIQGASEGHSSLEDARSALMLYRKREELIAQGGGAWDRQLRAIEEATYAARSGVATGPAGHHRRGATAGARR